MAEMNQWVSLLVNSGRLSVASGIEHSFEARDRLVRTWYVQYLGRPAANFEEQGFVAALVGGATEEQVLSEFLGSADYFAHTPGIIGMTGTPASNQTYVMALFEQVLQRAPALIAPSEVQQWVSALGILSRDNVALQFLTGPS
jgi:hypothetical protein